MKKIISIVLLSIIALSLVACGKNVKEIPTQEVTEAPIEETTVLPSEDVEPQTEEESTTDPSDDEYIEKMDVFGEFDSITKIADSVDDGKNLLYSPLSLNYALAMISEGASDEIKKDFEKYFGLPFDEYINDYTHYIAPSDNVEIANAFFTKKGFDLNEGFKEAIENYFKAEAGTYEFNDDFVKMVNKWCAEKTHNMIQNILNDVPDCKSIAINALYFKGKWETDYTDDDIKEDDFTLLDKTKVKNNFLMSTENRYFENEKATGFMKLYKGDRYAFVGILPKEEGNFTLSDLNIGSLLKNSSREDVNVKIPQFEFDAEYELTDSLKDVGLGSTLDPSKEPFPYILKKGSMEINKIIQKTKIKLDREGTEAAAVTVIEMDNAAVKLNEPKEVSLNRPFAFLIYDTQENKTLFIGKVINPAE